MQSVTSVVPSLGDAGDTQLLRYDPVDDAVRLVVD